MRILPPPPWLFWGLVIWPLLMAMRPMPAGALYALKCGSWEIYFDVKPSRSKLPHSHDGKRCKMRFTTRKPICGQRRKPGEMECE